MIKHLKIILILFTLFTLITSCTSKQEKVENNTKTTHEDIDMYVTLNSGYKMPILGIGTWTLDNDEAQNSVYWALKDGYRLIDTARYYRNEVGVGKGIAQAIEEGIVTREEIFVTSKIMPGDYDRAYKGIEDSLKDLGLDYLDLILIHQPGYNDEEVYKAMEAAYENGLVHSIGISNYYTRKQLDEVLSYANITPAIIQNENHIYFQNYDLKDYSSNYNIYIESWYPFGGRGHTSENFNNPVIQEIAKVHNKSAAQIILRWHIQSGYITIPGSSNPDHIAENYDIFDFRLTDEEMEQINNIYRDKRYENW